MHPHFQSNEDYETYSAASSGNNSAFSEGDVYNPNYHTPNHNTHHHAYGGYLGHMSTGLSNQATYGFTPNIQFTGSNQKHYAYSNERGFGMSGPNGGVGDITPEAQGSPFVHNDIQITGQDVNLQRFQIGFSPRRNSSEFNPT